jgi:hypothetical protein
VSIWVIYGIITAVGVLLIAGIVIGSIVLWRRQLSRSLIGLVGRRESVRAAYRALESVFSALAEESADGITAFAVDPSSEHRKALEELQSRMAILVEELQAIALPKAFWHSADLLMAAAAKLRDEVGKINTAPTPDAVLAGVRVIDVAGIRSGIAAAGEELDRLLRENHIEDPAVYGGGLYI